MRAPRWFHDAVGRARTSIDTGRPADEITRALAARILADEAFTLAIVTDYAARKLDAKKPVAKRPPWKNPASRRDYVAQLRSDGMTVRQIAGYVGISISTVHADLVRWEHEHATVTALPFGNRVRSASATSTNTHGTNTDSEHDASVITLRGVAR